MKAQTRPRRPSSFNRSASASASRRRSSTCRHFTELGQHRPQREADLEGLLQRGPTLRQRVEGAERLCKPRPRVLERRPRQPPCRRPAGDSARPSPAIRRGARDGRAARSARRGDPGRHVPSRRPVPAPAASSASATARWRSRRRGREQPAIRDLADPIVGEVQLVSHGLEHVVADHLLDRLRRVALVHPAGGLEEREVEPAPDDRGHGGHLLTARTEPVEAPDNEIADARGQGQRARCLASATPLAVLIERANRLHGDEGIALAHRPDLRLRPAPPSGRRSRRARAPARAARCRVVTVVRAPPACPGTREIGPPRCAGPSRRRQARFFARGRDQECRPRRNAATHEGQEPETHLVGPVQILQHEHQRLAVGDLLDELGHALEQGQGAVARRRQAGRRPPRAAGGSTPRAARDAGRRGSPHRR